MKQAEHPPVTAGANSAAEYSLALIDQLARIDRSRSKEEMDELVYRLLSLIGEAMLSDRVFLFERLEGTAEAYCNTFEWCANGVAPQIDNLTEIVPADMPYWLEVFGRGETIVIPNIEDVKTQMPSEYEILKTQSIHSEIAVPVFYRGNLSGFFGLDNPQRTLTDNTGHYEEVANERQMHRLTGHSGRASVHMSEMSKQSIVPEYLPYVEPFFDLSTLAERLRREDSVMLEYPVRDGNWHLARFIVQTRGKNGEAEQVLFAMRLYSEEKRREKDLMSAADAARRANEAKSEFLSRMSHDIRTPMNVIMGFTNIALQHADDSDKMKECLEKIRVSGSNLQELIDDVLDISRIESGEFKTVSQPVKLPELFDFYCQAIAGMAEAKNIRFSGKLHDISHNVLLSDQIRLGQIYMNLLSNAVKYTPENGDVKFEVYEEKLAESGKVRLVSVVSDTGIGMMPEFMEQMYSAFSRAVDTRVKVRGSGLGLAIVKKIVDLMGGAIEAESKVGKGTTFRVTLDLPAAADDAETEEHTETAITLPEKPLTVLVAENNDLNYEITAEQLRGYKVHCVRAVNGQDCLQRIEQAAPDEFDAILMDMQMPVMNGLEATAAIRKLDSETAKHIPIIALTANAYHEDIQKCLAAGMNAHLSKPINIDRAMRTIIECARTAKENG